MRTPCSLRGTRAASATFVKTRGDRDSRRAGPCTYMHVLRTQTAGLTCGVERSTHGSTGPSGRPLQTDLGAWASWKEVYERPSSRCADPRLVVTHRFTRAQWCKGWKTLPSYRLEGPVSSRPSPVGQWFPHKTWASAAFTAVRWMPLNLGGCRANWIA